MNRNIVVWSRLAAAAFLIREGDVPGQNITILEVKQDRRQP
ncbi:MAG: oleate hydratase [Candidatus Sulfotelmatobacter sp.]